MFVERLRQEIQAATPEDRIRRGHAAKRLLGDETFLDVVELVQKAAIIGWTDAGAAGERERFSALNGAVEALLAMLRGMASDAEFEEAKGG